MSVRPVSSGSQENGWKTTAVVLVTVAVVVVVAFAVYQSAQRNRVREECEEGAGRCGMALLRTAKDVATTVGPAVGTCAAAPLTTACAGALAGVVATELSRSKPGNTQGASLTGRAAPV